MSPPQTPKLSWLPCWPPDWPEIRSALEECFLRGDWGKYQGPATKALRERFCELTGVGNCQLCSSGSAAVELALKAVGIGASAAGAGGKSSRGIDGVAVCGYDYPGNFRAIELVGGRPVLIDAESDSYSLSAHELSRVDPGQIKAVLVSHLFGVSAKIEQIRNLCDDRGWSLVEDACQTPGMPIGDRVAGAWGDIGVVSFGGSKPLTSGNGGALLFSDSIYRARLAAMIDRPSDAYPLSELQASVLLPQLDRLDRCNQRRGAAARGLADLFRSLPVLQQRSSLVTLCQPENATIYKLALQCDWKSELLQRLVSAGLPVGEGYRSMHRSSRRRCEKIGELERCQQLEESVVLLDHSALLAEDVGLLCETLAAALQGPGQVL